MEGSAFAARDDYERARRGELGGAPPTLHAARGLLEGTAHVDPSVPAVWAEGASPETASRLRAVADAAGVPPAREVVRDGRSILAFRGPAAVDLLGRLYGGLDGASPHCPRWYAAYAAALGHEDGEVPECAVRLADPKAVLPTKANPSDVGYDLTVVGVAKRLSENVALYDTGIQIRPPRGYYAEIVPRSSLSKSGYVLANSVGIVDPGYAGNLLVALARVDPGAAPVELPFRCCQLVFRRQEHVRFRVDDSRGDETARGTGGFGSSGGAARMEAGAPSR